VGSLDRAREHNQIWRPWLERQLADLGLELSRSVANFVLVHFKPPHDAGGAFSFLQSRAILTRKVAGYGLPEHLRITIGTEEEMRAVAAAVRDYMAS
jgi:histidinol-phosphate aminotransferase